MIRYPGPSPLLAQVAGTYVRFMKVAVVYESMFGHTRAVAEAVQAGLVDVGLDVELATTRSMSIAEATAFDALVLGGPTHGRGLASSASRRAAQEQADADASVDLDASTNGITLRRWLGRLADAPEGRRPPVAGVFGTRLTGPRWRTGAASIALARRIRWMGAELVAAPESFLVVGQHGPLADGELDRARTWGRELGGRLVDTVPAVG